MDPNSLIREDDTAGERAVDERAASCVSVSRMTVRFGSQTLVRNLTMSVPSGAIYGLLGPNGAGKTTTLRATLGLVVPLRGEVRLFGIPVARDQHRMRQQLTRVGALIESPAFYPQLSGLDNVRAMCLLRGIAQSKAMQCLSDVDLQRSATKSAGTYSLGMKQRLALALALVADPDLLVLDEPANGLDPEGIVQTREMILRLNREEGISVLMSSHILSEVEAMASHVGLLRQGEMVYEANMATLRSQHCALLIRVDDVGAACAVLHAEYPTGLTLVADQDGMLRITGVPVDHAAHINHALCVSGIMVSHVSVVRRSLEELFLAPTPSSLP